MNQISTYQYNSTSNSRDTYLGYFAGAGSRFSLQLREDKELTVGSHLLLTVGAPTLATLLGQATVPPSRWEKAKNWQLGACLFPTGLQVGHLYLGYFAGAGCGSSLQLGHNSTQTVGAATLATLRGQAADPPSSWEKAKSTMPRCSAVRFSTCKQS